jgi:hypothetical protein
VTQPVPEPYAWIYTVEGIRRQVKIHVTKDGNSVVWAPRSLGCTAPWFDADRAEDDPAAYYRDEDLVTLGKPVTAWSGFED